MNFHGGNIYELKKEVLDFSSNINPLGVPESFKKALLEQINAFTKYPDIEYKSLRQCMGRYVGVENTEYIVPGNGAVEVIYKYMVCIRNMGFKRLVCLAPTFSEYSRAAQSCGMEVISVEAFRNAYKNVDIKKILELADGSTAIVLCNPNNPTGTLISKRYIEELLEGLRIKGSRLLIDEAFIEFTEEYPSSSAVSLLSQYSNLTIVRAVTKFFGMPGIRLGYGITFDNKLANSISELLEPWNINTAAVIAGCTVLTDKDYIEASKAWLSSERGYLYQQLKSIDAIEVFEAQVNFHLVRLRHEAVDARKLRDKLIEKGILIRTPDGFKGLSPYYFRLAVKDRDSNNKLIKALKEVMESVYTGSVYEST